MADQENNEQLEIIHEFINETRDMINDLEPTIIGMEEMVGQDLDADDKETLNGVFRLFHSVKGGAGFLNFGHLVQCTHTAENLLDQLRNGELTLSSEHVDLLCQSCDFSKEALDYIEEHGDDSGITESADNLMTRFKEATSCPAEQTPEIPPRPDELIIDLETPARQLISAEDRQKFVHESSAIIKRIETNLNNSKNNKKTAAAAAEAILADISLFHENCHFLTFDELDKLTGIIMLVLENSKSHKTTLQRALNFIWELIEVFQESLDNILQHGMDNVYGLEMYLELFNNLLPPDAQVEIHCPPPTRLGEILIQEGIVKNEDIEQALSAQERPIGEILVDQGLASREQVNKAVKIQKKLRPMTGKSAVCSKIPKRQEIRVDLEKLDNLINLIGEIVIAENMVIHSPDLHNLELDNFNKAAGHLSKIVRELQEMAMVIRMLPISGLFRRMMRLVRDLSRKSGKKVELQLVGEDTEVDKTVIEKITDPLVHLIRNSLDHGIGTPEERAAAGKPESGVLRLEARHEEGEVQITITDDGRGMDKKRLIAKAVNKGLLEGDGSQLSDAEALQLIFKPGFSTAEQITDISGRGVGMDVVRKNLEEIKGRVDVISELGSGTTITLHIPLTLAIIDGMLIRVGDSRYIIPILSIRESFKPDSSAITITPDGRELVRVRNSLLPILRLHKIHNIEPDSRRFEDGILIILESREGNICLFVDELLGQQQTVIKSLSQYIGRQGEVSGVSGCTILSDGEVCLILDVQALVE
ncbi:MAG TPA: chemotaxis protein CheA [Desulfobacterales bacterium]|nr:chemotaxis protein CheA [Desulfobacterales bacterium]